jgi:hypothetical protein
MDLAETHTGVTQLLHEGLVGRSVTEVEQHRVVAARVDGDRQFAALPSLAAVAVPVARLVRQARRKGW